MLRAPTHVSRLFHVPSLNDGKNIALAIKYGASLYLSQRKNKETNVPAKIPDESLTAIEAIEKLKSDAKLADDKRIVETANMLGLSVSYLGGETMSRLVKAFDYHFVTQRPNERDDRPAYVRAREAYDRRDAWTKRFVKTITAIHDGSRPGPTLIDAADSLFDQATATREKLGKLSTKAEKLHVDTKSMRELHDKWGPSVIALSVAFLATLALVLQWLQKDETRIKEQKARLEGTVRHLQSRRQEISDSFVAEKGAAVKTINELLGGSERSVVFTEITAPRPALSKKIAECEIQVLTLKNTIAKLEAELADLSA
jgi:hypothetical protein